MANESHAGAAAAAPGELALSGQLIAGKYRVEKLIGMGGMGVVVSAWHVDLERRVALKLVRSELAAHEAAMQRLILEARAAAKLASEHVCRVIDVGRLDSGAPYLVMELLEGADLAQVLEQRGSIGIEEAVEWVLQACEAVAEAHSVGIVHRDLKPENLFVTRSGGLPASIKVLDFGISKRLRTSERALTNPGMALGSPQYMAPEQMLSGDAVDERADIWALGAILYELIGGRAAFEGDTLPALCAKVLEEAPLPLRELAPHVPAPLESVVLRCLSKMRDERFPSIAHLARALAPFGGPRAHQSLSRIDPSPSLEPSSSALPATVAPRLPLDATGAPGSLPIPLETMAQPTRRKWLGALPLIVVGLGVAYLAREWALSQAPRVSSGNPRTPTAISEPHAMSDPAPVPAPAAPVARRTADRNDDAERDEDPPLSGGDGDDAVPADVRSAARETSGVRASQTLQPARRSRPWRERRPVRPLPRGVESAPAAQPVAAEPVALPRERKVNAWDLASFGKRR